MKWVEKYIFAILLALMAGIYAYYEVPFQWGRFVSGPLYSISIWGLFSNPLVGILFGIFYVTASLTAIWGIFKRSTWGRSLTVIIIFLTILHRIASTLVLGIYGETTHILITLAVPLIAIILLSKKPLREKFMPGPGYRLVEKVILILSFLSLFFLTIVYFSIIVPLQKSISDLNKPPEKVRYSDCEERYLLQEELLPRELPNCSLYLPASAKVMGIDRGHDNDKIAQVVLADSSALIIISRPPWAYSQKYGYLFPGYNTPYEFERRVYYERLGGLYLKARHNIESMWGADSKEKGRDISTKIYEFSTIELKGFFIKVRKTDRILYDYHIYNHKSQAISVIFVLSPENLIPDTKRENIISSIRIPEQPGKSANQFFSEGLKFYLRGQFADAGFCFANAVAQDYDNACHQYYLALALAKTGEWSPSMTALKRALELKPDYAAALTLLETLQSDTKNIKKTQ
ncbi:MAG: hypothetical protein NTV06_04705 [candidate division Zixibacteria bacterium]|nr:hypothetical protein [candidate division Zixibacteria bacterium]